MSNTLSKYFKQFWNFCVERPILFSIMFAVHLYINNLLISKYIIIDKFTLMSIRFFISLLVLIPFFQEYNIKTIISSPCLSLHIARACSSVIIVASTYYAYQSLPLSIGSAVGMSEPLFVGLITIFKGHKLSLQRWISLIAGYIGLIMISNIFFKPIELHSNFTVPIIVFLGANSLCALMGFLIQDIRAIENEAKTENRLIDTRLLFLNHIVIIIGSLICRQILIFNEISVNAFSDLWLCFDKIILLSVSGAIGSILIINTFRYLHPTTHALCQNIRSAAAILTGILFFNEPITTLQLTGCVILLLSIFSLKRK